jgi:hypothetical protein
MFVNPPLPISIWMREQILMKLGMHIMASEPIWTAYFINPFHQSVCLYVYPSHCCKATAWLSVSLHSVLGNGSLKTFSRQRIHAAIEELLDAFSMLSVSYEKGLWACVSPNRRCSTLQLGKDFTTATKNCWKRPFLCGPCRIEGKWAISSSQNFLFQVQIPSITRGHGVLSFRDLKYRRMSVTAAPAYPGRRGELDNNYLR